MEPVAVNFIDLTTANVLSLFVIGFVGGLVSGFIGSGGAFVLTPAMMSMGVAGVVAVASNMCHKFPKALVGAYKRYRFGHVDIKLGLVMAATASVGVWVGADIQQHVKFNYGEAGSNLYVSLSFVIVLAIVGSYVLRDAIRIYRTGDTHAEDRTSRLAAWVQSVEIPGTMIHFKTANVRVSALFTIPLGLATGMLAATIAGAPSTYIMPGTPIKPPTAMVAASMPVANPSGIVNSAETRTPAVLKCIMVPGISTDCTQRANREV